MTSISGSSHLSRLQSELTSQVKAGTVKSTDQDALSGALQSIDASLSASRSGEDTSSSRPDPSQVKSKIDGLIAGQVSAGTLTDDQATELKSVLQSVAPKGGHGGHGGPGGPGGAGGPPPGGPPPGDTDASSGATSATTSSSTPSTTTNSSDLLAEFVKQLQTSLQDGYGQGGTAKISSQTSLLFSITA